MGRRTPISLLFIVTSVAFGGEADEARAIALFEEGRRLVAAGDHEAACSRFEAAERLAPSLSGIVLNLADCLERTGRNASAWNAFRRVATVLDPRRAQYAAERADALEPRLAWLTITVEPEVGLVARLDGSAVEPGAAVAVDPGSHDIEVEGRGLVGWLTRVEVEPGKKVEVLVPPVLPAVAPHVPQPIALTEAPRPASHGKLVLSLAIGGAAGLATAVALAITAKVEYDSAASNHCDANLVCDRSGIDAIRAARTKATVASFVGGAGAAALAAAAILHFSEKSGSAATVIQPVVSARSVGLNLVGAW